MVQTKTLVYTGLIVGGLGIITYLIYVLSKPTKEVVKAIKEIFKTIQAAGEYVDTLWGLNVVVSKWRREYDELARWLTNSAKLNAFYIMSWYNKWSIWWTGYLSGSNEFIFKNPTAMNICRDRLRDTELLLEMLLNTKVKNLPWDKDTPIPMLRNQEERYLEYGWELPTNRVIVDKIPEFIAEVVEERITIP